MDNILKLFIEKGFLLDRDMLDFFNELDDGKVAREILDKIAVVSQKKVITKSLVDENIEKIKPILFELDSEKRKLVSKYFVNVRISVEVTKESVLEDEERLKLLVWEAVSYNERRSAKAAEAVVSIGRPAINFLRRLLPSSAHGDNFFKGPQYYVTEGASRLLTRIGEPAVPALVDALLEYDGHSRPYVIEALKTITGEDHGQSPEKWRAWYVNQKK